jgi:hypothetical protein
MKRQASVGKRTLRSKSKQTSLFDFESSSVASSSSNRSNRSTTTSKRAEEKLRRAAYSSLSADILPRRGAKSAAADVAKKAAARRQSCGDTSIASRSSSNDTATTQKASNNTSSKRNSKPSGDIEAKKPSKRTKKVPNDVDVTNDTKNKAVMNSDITQHHNNDVKRNETNENDQEDATEVTPAAKITQLRHVTIEPKPIPSHRQLYDSSQIITPHFHTSWTKPYSQNSPPLPPGVIDIDTFHHQCCSLSLISHCGYSWVTSSRRCGCEIDANHNSIESYTQSYMGTYGQERCTSKLHDEWKVEQWCLDRVKNDRSEQLERMKKGLEKRWDVTNMPPSVPIKLELHLDYMYRQPHINKDMRAILMDWLVELAEEYKLTSETLFLSGMLVDRSLAMSYGVEGSRGGEMIVQKDQLQCVGW